MAGSCFASGPNGPAAIGLLPIRSALNGHRTGACLDADNGLTPVDAHRVGRRTDPAAAHLGHSTTTTTIPTTTTTTDPSDIHLTTIGLSNLNYSSTLAFTWTPPLTNMAVAGRNDNCATLQSDCTQSTLASPLNALYRYDVPELMRPSTLLDTVYPPSLVAESSISKPPHGGSDVRPLPRPSEPLLNPALPNEKPFWPPLVPSFLPQGSSISPIPLETQENLDTLSTSLPAPLTSSSEPSPLHLLELPSADSEISPFSFYHPRSPAYPTITTPSSPYWNPCTPMGQPSAYRSFSPQISRLHSSSSSRQKLSNAPIAPAFEPTGEMLADWELICQGFASPDSDIPSLASSSSSSSLSSSNSSPSSGISELGHGHLVTSMTPYPPRNVYGAPDPADDFYHHGSVIDRLLQAHGDCFEGQRLSEVDFGLVMLDRMKDGPLVLSPTDRLRYPEPEESRIRTEKRRKESHELLLCSRFDPIGPRRPSKRRRIVV